MLRLHKDEFNDVEHGVPQEFRDLEFNRVPSLYEYIGANLLLISENNISDTSHNSKDINISGENI